VHKLELKNDKVHDRTDWKVVTWIGGGEEKGDIWHVRALKKDIELTMMIRK